jgi:hypothetical protein
MKNQRKKVIKFSLLSILLLSASLITSHYTESLLTPLLKSLKYLVLYDKTDNFEGEIYTNYSFVKEPVINPVHVAQKAFYMAETLLIKNIHPSHIDYAYDREVEIDVDKIIEVADLLLSIYKPEVIDGKEVIRMPYTFNYPSYDLNTPWYSGMAQGLATVVVLAAYDITQNKKYLDSAEKIVETMFIPIRKGGTLIYLSEKSVWHEEYADQKKSEHPMVLNGNIFAIDGLFWINEFSKEDKWADILVKSFSGLNENIKRYDGFFWSKYGLMGNYANWHYHSLHIVQLNKITEFYSKGYTRDVSNIVKYLNMFSIYKLIPLGFTERLLFQSNNMLFAVLLINLFFFIMLFVGIRKVKSSIR